MLFECGLSLQALIQCGHFGLTLKLVEVDIEFTQDIVNAGEIFTRVVQAVGRFAAALFVFRNASGFLQKQAQLFWLAFNNTADGALANDGVSARTKASPQKHVLNVTPTHQLVVYEVTAVAFTGQHATHSNFRKLTPLTTCAVIGIVKHQLHAGTVGRFSGGGAVKNNVLHGLATQLRRF